MRTAATAKSICDISYFGTAPSLTLQIDLKDSAGTVVATTSTFTPSAGFNTVACSSFPAAGVGKVLMAYYTITGYTSGSVVLYSGNVVYGA